VFVSLKNLFTKLFPKPENYHGSANGGDEFAEPVEGWTYAE
jgi:hypothetical protein